MTLIRILPQYGYGWMKRGQSIDMPPPFWAEIDATEFLAEDSETPAPLTGRITDKNHEYDGMKIVLMARTIGIAPTYNVRIFPDENTNTEHAYSVSDNAPLDMISGFAVAEI